MSSDSGNRGFTLADLHERDTQSGPEITGTNVVLEAYGFLKADNTNWDQASGGSTDARPVAPTTRRPTWYEQNIPIYPAQPTPTERPSASNSVTPTPTRPPRDMGPAPSAPGYPGPLVGKDPPWKGTPVIELPYPHGKPGNPIDAPPVVDPRSDSEKLESNLTLVALLGGCFVLMRGGGGRLAGPLALGIIGKLIWDNRPG